MRKTYRILGYVIAAEVVVQAMAIAYAMAGLSYWVAEDDGVLNKAVMESDDMAFPEIVGFIVHGINGMMVIPLLALLFLVFSFFTKVVGASKRAGALIGLVVLQVFLGIFSHSLPASILLHALNAFAIAVLAFTSARRARDDAAAAPMHARESVSA